MYELIPAVEKRFEGGRKMSMVHDQRIARGGMFIEAGR